MRWPRIMLLLFHLLILVLMVASCTGPTSIPAGTTPSPTTPTGEPPTSTAATPPTTTTTPPVQSPPITIALDYFGVRNTHWIPQIGGDPLAKIQLVMVVSDEQQNLAVRTIPPERIPGFDMDFFQVKAVEAYMDPVVFRGSVTGSLTVYVVAYNVNKGPVTNAQIDVLSKWLGFPGLEVLKSAVKERELVGHYWYTWSPSSNWGVGSHTEKGEGDLRVWLRIWSDEVPEPAQQPVLKPNVQIEAVKLPNDARIRTQWDYRSSDFSFILANYESFELPIYWRLESSPKSPGTEINFLIYPTYGTVPVPGNGKVPVNAKYWFTTPGDYQWKYIIECPKGNPVTSWTGTLTVSP